MGDSKKTLDISEFNKGNASRIFQELEEAGVMFVEDNNERVGVMFSVKEFEEIMELIEDYELLNLAYNRIEKSTGAIVSLDDAMRLLDISESKEETRK